MLPLSCTRGKDECFPLSDQPQEPRTSTHLLSHGPNLCAFASLREIFLPLFLRFLRLFFPVNAQNHKALAYGTFRFALGVVELMHGLVRIPMLAGFAAGMAKQFEGTIMPGWFVYSFGSVLPFLEGLIGLALILGISTRWALVAASLLMSVLIFGTCLRSDWNIVGLQMIYAIAFFIALFFLEHNRYSVDRILRREEA